MNIIDEEIEKLLKKGVITKGDEKHAKFVSGIFTRPKKDGSMRFILNLKYLNKYMEYNHFKMESINHVFNVIRPNAYMASVDLKDDFFSISICIEDQKYLFFRHRGIFYKFTCMPNGYGPAMRAFTKILKVPYACLRRIGHISVYYVDD